MVRPPSCPGQGLLALVWPHALVTQGPRLLLEGSAAAKVMPGAAKGTSLDTLTFKQAVCRLQPLRPVPAPPATPEAAACQPSCIRPCQPSAL